MFINNQCKQKVAIVAYTEYSRDSRVRRATEALVEAGFRVDCFVLRENVKGELLRVGDIDQIPTSSIKYRGQSLAKYAVSYLWFFGQVFLLLTIAAKKKYQLIHVHNMPNFIVFAAVIPKILGSKVILDIHDTMPEAFAAKFTGLASRLFCFLLLQEERLSAWFVDKVIAVHYPQKQHILKNHGIKEEKIVVITNLADRNLFNPLKYTVNRDDHFKLIYHGTIAPRFGLDIVLLGLKKVVHEHARIRFDIYGTGDGLDQIKSLISKENLSSFVRVHGTVPLTEIPGLIAKADLGVVPYARSKATEYMLPLKLMEYIAMLLPVLTVKNTTISYYFADRELEHYESNDPDSFAERLCFLIENPDRLTELRNNAMTINERMNWESEKYKYIFLVEGLVNGKY